MALQQRKRYPQKGRRKYSKQDHIHQEARNFESMDLNSNSICYNLAIPTLLVLLKNQLLCVKRIHHLLISKTARLALVFVAKFSKCTTTDTAVALASSNVCSSHQLFHFPPFLEMTHIAHEEIIHDVISLVSADLVSRDSPRTSLQTLRTTTIRKQQSERQPKIDMKNPNSSFPLSFISVEL